MKPRIAGSNQASAPWRKSSTGVLMTSIDPHEPPTLGTSPQTDNPRDISWFTLILCYVVIAFGKFLLAKTTYHPLVVGGVLVQSLGYAFLTAVDFLLAGAIVLVLRYTVNIKWGRVSFPLWSRTKSK